MAAVFQILPFHYLEISKILLVHAKEAFGSDLLKVIRHLINMLPIKQSFGHIILEARDARNKLQVKELIGDICKVRLSKINAGVQVLQGPMTVKLNNLSAAQCNVIRPFFQGALDRFHLLASVRVCSHALCASCTHSQLHVNTLRNILLWVTSAVMCRNGLSRNDLSKLLIACRWKLPHTLGTMTLN